MIKILLSIQKKQVERLASSVFGHKKTPLAFRYGVFIIQPPLNHIYLSEYNLRLRVLLLRLYSQANPN